MQGEFGTLVAAKAARRRRSRNGELHLIWRLPDGTFAVKHSVSAPVETWTLIPDLRR